MDEDNRWDEQTDEEDSEAGWYFDLPKGAWERQEAKNRELRQSVRRNMDTEDPKKDIFGGKSAGRDLREEDEPPSWRSLHGDDDTETDAPRWRLPEFESTPGPAGGEEREETPPLTDYSTEPEIPSPTAFRLRSQRLPDEDPEPHLTPPPGLFSDASDDDRPGIASFGGDEPALRELSHASGEEEFEEPAASESSVLEGMRSWAGAAKKPGAEENREEPDAREPIPHPAAAGPSPIPLRLYRHEEEAPAEPPAGDGDGKKSRWDEMFSAKAGDDNGLLDSMRAWATRPADGDEDESGPPRMRLAPEEEEVPEDFFKPFEWEAAEDSPASTTMEPLKSAQPEVDEGKPGILGKLFGRKKKAEPAPVEFDYSIDDGSTWLPQDEVRADLPPEMSVLSNDGERFGSWLKPSEDDAEPASDEPGWPASKDDAATEAEPAAGFSWQPLVVEEAATEAEAEPALDWQPSRSEETGAQRSTAFGWEPVSADDAEPGTKTFESAAWNAEADGDAEDSWNPEPVPADSVAEPPIAVEEDGPTVAEGDVVAVAPEQPDAEAGSDEDMAGWVRNETVETFSTPGPIAVADEDPWEPVRAIEEQADDSPPRPAEARPDEPGVQQAPVSSLFGFDESPDTADTESGEDPWAAFIPRSAVEEPVVPAGEPAQVAPEAAAEPEPEPDSSQEQGSLWDSAFARVHDTPLEAEEPGEPEVESEPDSAAASDDPWAAIAQVSGYDSAPGGIAVYRGTQDVEEALDRYKAEREEEEAFATELAAAAQYELPEDAGLEFDESKRASLPEWDDSKIVDDTILRAFEAHALAYDEEGPMAQPEQEPVFDDLLGEDAEEIVAEASQPPSENRYFGRMQGWAPQRSTSGDRAAFPWETDRDEPSREPDARDDEDEPIEGWGNAAEAPPPWNGGGDAALAGGHHEAPSVRHRSRSRMLVREIVETGLLALLVFLAVRASFQNFKVDGLSMWPTLEDGEYLIVNKLAYAEVDMGRVSKVVPFVDAGSDPEREVFGGPERGDIIVLKNPAEPDVDLIKRIVGLPGETIEIVDGKVYINDHLLIEPYIKQPWHDTKPKIAIPEGYYFVMGDNRENSSDSRSTRVGLIPKDLIIGKAMLTYWPKNKFGLAPNESGDISEKDGRPAVTAQTIER